MIQYTYCHLRTLHLLGIAPLFLHSILITAESPLDALYTWFNAYAFQETLYKEYMLNAKAEISVCIDHTLQGSIGVYGWEHNKVAITSTKKVSREQSIKSLAILVEQTDQKLALTTGYAKGKKKPQGSCALDLIIHTPHNTALTIDSTNNVTVEKIHKQIVITTERGSVEGVHIGPGGITAHIDTRGTIILENVHGPIDARNTSGNIVIKNSFSNVTAHAESGDIELICARMPTDCSIDLKTATYGSIGITIPENTQATIVAFTERGMIRSTIPITIRPNTTVLNTVTYKKMLKQLYGTIGQQGNAEIQLSSAHGITITAAIS